MLDSILASGLMLPAFLVCTAVSLVLGIATAFLSMYRSKCSQGFAVTVAVLPAIVQIVILLVNGNLGDKSFFDAANAGEPEALEVLEKFCFAVDVQIYNLSVLLNLEKVAIGGGISSQPLLIETLDRVYEEQILKGHPFSEEQARSLAHPEIVACAFHNKSNQIGALVSYQNAFYPQK